MPADAWPMPTTPLRFKVVVTGKRGLGFRARAELVFYLNSSLNSFKGGYLGDYVGAYYRGY